MNIGGFQKNANLEIINYNTGLVENDVVKDFCARFNLRRSKNTPERMNESLSFSGLILLFHFNKISEIRGLKQLEKFDECKKLLNWNIKKYTKTPFL